MLEEVEVLTEKEEEIYGRNTTYQGEERRCSDLPYVYRFWSGHGLSSYDWKCERLEALILGVSKSGGLGMIAKELLDWFHKLKS